MASKAKLRKKLRIEPNLPTLLIVGGERVKNVVETVEALENLEHDFQVVAVAGGNDRLFLDLVKLKPKFPLHVHHFLSNMPEWLRAADVLISKAGGLIISEGLAAGLPILIIHYLPGQEEGNVRYVLSHQAGALPANTGEAVATLDYWLKMTAMRLNSPRRLPNIWAGPPTRPARWRRPFGNPSMIKRKARHRQMRISLNRLLKHLTKNKSNESCNPRVQAPNTLAMQAKPLKPAQANH